METSSNAKPAAVASARPSPPEPQRRRRYCSFAGLVAALLAGLTICGAVGAVGLGVAFEDYCLTRAGDRASSGPVVHIFPPSVECSYQSDGHVTTERRTRPVLDFAAGWLVGTTAVLLLVVFVWTRLIKAMGRSAKK